MTDRTRSINPNMFKSPVLVEPPPLPQLQSPTVAELEPAPLPPPEPELTPEPAVDPAPSTQPKQRKRPKAAAKGETESPNGKPTKHYDRLNLYVDKDIKRRVRRFVTEANAAELPLGQRGASVIMVAALDLYAQHTKAERLEAVERRL